MEEKIEEKIKQAKLFLVILLKEIQKIIQKLNLRKYQEKYQSLSEEEILETIYDILGITIVISQLENVYFVRDLLIKKLMESDLIIDYQEGSDYLKKQSKAGYQGILCYFRNRDGMMMEIQITDQVNLKVREETHEQFNRIKYDSK